MVSLAVIMRHELVDGPQQAAFPEKDQGSRHSSRIERTKRSA